MYGVEKNMNKKTEDFKRKDDYTKDTIHYLQTILKYEKQLKTEEKIDADNGILIMPNADCIKVYYKGKTLIDKLTNAEFKLFPTSYDKYFKTENEELILTNLRKKEKNQDKIESLKEYFLQNLAVILNCIKQAHARQKEREYQSLIALNHMTFQKEKYSVCGFETAISSMYFDNETKPEIDLVVFSPNENKFVLVEYKCKKDSLLKSKQDIVKHCDDYLHVLKKHKEDNAFPFVKEMLKAYHLLCKIYNKPVMHIDISKTIIDIAFLITQKPYNDICASDYDKARQKLEHYFQVEAKEKGVEKYLKNIFYLTEIEPQNVRFSHWETELKGK